MWSVSDKDYNLVRPKVRFSDDCKGVFNQSGRRANLRSSDLRRNNFQLNLHQRVNIHVNYSINELLTHIFQNIDTISDTDKIDLIFPRTFPSRCFRQSINRDFSILERATENQKQKIAEIIDTLVYPNQKMYYLTLFQSLLMHSST